MRNKMKVWALLIYCLITALFAILGYEYIALILSFILVLGYLLNIFATILAVYIYLRIQEKKEKENERK